VFSYIYIYITIVERYGVVPVNYDRGDEIERK